MAADYAAGLRLVDALAQRVASEEERAHLEGLMIAPLPAVPRSERCPHCGQDAVTHDPSAHLPRCARLPARVRYQLLHRVAMALGGEDGFVAQHTELLQLSFETDALDVFAMPWREETRALMEPLSAPRRARAWKAVRREVARRLHAVDRASDPCPWCSAVMPLAEAGAHLAACRRHPALQFGLVLHDALLDRYGDVRVTAAWNGERELEAHAALREVLDACVRYDAELGYEDADTYYSKAWQEKPWLEALYRAQRFSENGATDASPALAATLGAITQVVGTSFAFWNGMSDGERGRSMIRRSRCEDWNQRLAELRREASLS